MSESKKAILAYFVIVSAVTAAIFWSQSPATLTVWTVRIATTTFGVVVLAYLLFIMLRRDHEFDCLRSISRKYFERKGFCFILEPMLVEDIGAISIIYQNRYDRPVQAQIVLKARGNRHIRKSSMSTISIGVELNGIECRQSIFRMGVPAALQGRKVKFEVGATVWSRQGRGRMVRFRDGLAVGSTGAKVFQNALTIMAAATGTLVITRPAFVELEMPGAPEILPIEYSPLHTELWPSDDSDSDLNDHANDDQTLMPDSIC